MGNTRVSRSSGDHGTALKSVVVFGAVVGAVAVAASVVLTSMAGRRVADGATLLVATCLLLALGTLLVLRRPRNLVGWLCYAAGVLACLAALSDVYRDYGLGIRPGSLPGAMTVGWFSLWLGNVWTPILLLIPLVFPDGHLPSRRWRPAAWVAIGIIVVSTVGRALNPAVPRWASVMPYNPFGIVGAERWLAPLEQALIVGLAFPLCVGVLAVAIRFLRSAGVERLQLKWLMYSVGQLVALIVLYQAVPGGFPQPFSDLVFGISFSLVPMAIANAVMRYRLYDIDRIVNRTIVYAAVTVTLGAVYATSVLVIGAVFGGAGRRSGWVVAVSTLAGFGVFRPVRARAQNAVDRRFNRPRYDANRTVTTFKASLRDQLDIDTLANELFRVTRHAVQPDHVSLWLRKTSAETNQQPAVLAWSINNAHLRPGS